jgi:hypothetical protein
MGPDGKWRRPLQTSPQARMHRRLRQRDVSAALVQARALTDFIQGKPRADVLCFKSEVELRADYAKLLSRSANDHAQALEELCSRCVAHNRTNKKKISPFSVANALYGVYAWPQPGTTQ